MLRSNGGSVKAGALLGALHPDLAGGLPWAGELHMKSGTLAGRSAWLVTKARDRELYRVVVLTCLRWKPFALDHWDRPGYPTMIAAMTYLSELQDHIAAGGDPTQPYEPP